MAEQFSIPDLRPNFAILAGGSSAMAVVSFIFLPWPLAIASALLAILMIAGADVDARTLLLPDVVTYGALACGLIAAPVCTFLSGSSDPWVSMGAAILRAIGTGLLLALLREAYTRLRGNEGVGLGDVKLAAAVGAWLPLEAIPYCFVLATTAALVSVVVKRRGEALDGLKLPFGAFLCPALWLTFFASSLPR